MSARQKLKSSCNGPVAQRADKGLTPPLRLVAAWLRLLRPLQRAFCSVLSQICFNAGSSIIVSESRKLLGNFLKAVSLVCISIFSLTGLSEINGSFVLDGAVISAVSVELSLKTAVVTEWQTPRLA